VPDRRGEPDAVEVSVLLLLEDPALPAAGGDRPPQPEWVVDDAARCLASVLAQARETPFEVVLLDNGLGGAAGAWADEVASTTPGVVSVHLGEPVGFAEARDLQHRVARGRLVLWLDTGVELTGDAFAPLVEAFADPSVGLVGRWGGRLERTLTGYTAVDPPGPGEGVCDVHGVWGYLLALRRVLLREGRVQPDHGFRFYRNADAELSLQVLAADRRVVLADLPAVQHVHRGYSTPDPGLVTELSRQNWRRLRTRWQGVMEELVAGS
jgi:hypothetical protein